MPQPGVLETQWAELMSLCRTESDLRKAADHPRLLKLISGEIDRLARTMGFSDRLIATRDFRAERDGKRILRLVTE